MTLKRQHNKSYSTDNERLCTPQKTAKNICRYLLIHLVILPVFVIIGLQWYPVYSNEKVLLQQARQI
jgi:hypothetical protein